MSAWDSQSPQPLPPERALGLKACSAVTTSTGTAWLWCILFQVLGSHLSKFYLDLISLISFLLFLLLPCAVDCISTVYGQTRLCVTAPSFLLLLLWFADFFFPPDNGLLCFAFFLPSDFWLHGRHCGIHIFEVSDFFDDLFKCQASCWQGIKLL